MAETRRRQYVEVPLTIGDSIRYIKGVTKYTTCGDVVKMVLRKLDDGKENCGNEAYGIFESSRGIERPIPAKSRLLKVVRSWGTGNDYELVFRKVVSQISIPRLSEAKRRKLTNRHRNIPTENKRDGRCSSTRYSHPNEFVKELYFNDDSDSSLDEDIPSVSQANLQRYVLGQSCSSVDCEMSRHVTGQSCSKTFVVNPKTKMIDEPNCVKFAIRKSLKPNPGPAKQPVCNQAEATKKEGHRAVKRHERLACDIVSKISKLNQREGKDALLQKYFSDYITYRSPNCRFLDSRYRERGDGAESDVNVIPARGVSVNETYRISPQERRYNARKTLTFDEADSGHDDNSQDEFDFNAAFINDEPTVSTPKHHPTPVNVSPSVDETHVIDGVINITHDIIPQKLVDYSLSASEADSHFSDPSEISNASFVHNVSSVSDVVRSAFSESGAGSEDDAMESFMKTKLEEDFSDEGLSSLGSDDEKEILV